jgi:hypothetical protein
MRPISDRGGQRWTVWTVRAGTIIATVGLLAGCLGTSTGSTGSNGGVSINGVSDGNGYTFSSGDADDGNGSDGASGADYAPDGSYSYSFSVPDGVVGSGRLTSRTIDLSGVTSVVTGANFVVHLKTGAPAQAAVTMDDNLTDRIDATVTGNELRLGIKPGSNVRNATLSAELTVGQLNRLSANGASRIMLNPTLTTPTLQLALTGTSAVTGPVTVGQMQATSSGAATLGLSGQVQDLHLNVTGASQLPLANLVVRNLDATLSGANHATITVSDTLSAEVIGASVLRYRGIPHITRQQTLGVSSIEPDPS